MKTWQSLQLEFRSSSRKVITNIKLGTISNDPFLISRDEALQFGIASVDGGDPNCIAYNLAAVIAVIS